ncbi:MAG: STAS domain-containing protein [Bryobacterales bacterium]|nr:STAS domain-containing protein [Bryobacterales bacterium]
MPDTFQILEEQQGEVALLRLHGYLDAHTAAEFESAIQRRVDQGCACIVVDCEKLSYISSAGLGVFMSFIEELREKEGDIRIGGLLPKVRQVFDILGFTEIFQLFDTADAAVTSFQLKEEGDATNV